MNKNSFFRPGGLQNKIGEKLISEVRRTTKNIERKNVGMGPLVAVRPGARGSPLRHTAVHGLLRSDTRGPFFPLSKRRRLSDCTSDCDKSREASSELRDARGRCSEQRSFARRQLRPSVQCWVRYDGSDRGLWTEPCCSVKTHGWDSS